ncbi:EutN/CcmL family microcompartment protein [Neomoorella humiferrea]|uniref:EutN/CcmL family microcompartment protein n=1 Tax=Neomoorella humiferrea TaxID=676965 RepID=UPI003D8E9ADD
MLVAEVIGNVVSTRKNELLVGCKFLNVRLLVPIAGLPSEIVAVDNIGAGLGEKVLVVVGSAARRAVGENLPVDAAVVGIIDPVHE